MPVLLLSFRESFCLIFSTTWRCDNRAVDWYGLPARTQPRRSLKLKTGVRSRISWTDHVVHVVQERAPG